VSSTPAVARVAAAPDKPMLKLVLLKLLLAGLSGWAILALL
jgi:hypothetical protein